MTTEMVRECEEKGSSSVEDAYAKGKEAGSKKEGACPDSTLDRLLNEPKLTVPLREFCGGEKHKRTVTGCARDASYRLQSTRPRVSGVLLVRHRAGSKSRQSFYSLSLTMSSICFHSLDDPYCLFTCPLFLPWLELGQSAQASSVCKSEARSSRRRDRLRPLRACIFLSKLAC